MSNKDASHYETIAPSQTDQVLGGAGAAGDYLARLIIVVTTAAQSAVTLKDGAVVVPASGGIFPASPGGGVGTYVIDLEVTSQTGAWKVTTGSGVSVVAVGSFT